MPYDQRVTPDLLPAGAIAADQGRLRRHFQAGADILPLWIAEPYVAPAAEVADALRGRADVGWYGYEVRPSTESFWGWMATRHGWQGSGLHTSVSPSVGTSIGVLIDQLTEPGDGVILQPPVFTDFKPLIVRANRKPVRNPLKLDQGRYRMDLDHLAAAAAEPDTRMMILCNPHNPVGRVWSEGELADVAAICARRDVLVVADEIHSDLVLPPHRFTPFGPIAADAGTRWAATHGPIKTFGLAGVCDTLLVTDSEEITGVFRTRNGQLRLSRNNVFAVAAYEAAYSTDGSWLDGLLAGVAANLRIVQENLPSSIGVIEPEGTYLVWLDFRELGMDVPELAEWLASSAQLALSPGHWFGREGAGFARMTVAAPAGWIEEAVRRITQAM